MLPPTFFTGAVADRASHRRGDAAWIADRLGDAGTRFVPLWRDRNLMRPGESPAPAFWNVAEVRRATGEVVDPVFLGLDGDGTALFAIDLSGLAEDEAAAAAGAAEFQDLWQVGALLPPGEAGLLAYARGMLYWHRRHRFCGSCGYATEVRDAGHLRVCSNRVCAEHHFPRTDPAVIMLVTGTVDGEEACLMGRQARWPKGMYSTLAGFTEPGESLEEAVAREVREETGVEVTDVAYRGSQPWPFPSSLMLGFHARAVTTDITVDAEELEDARWFTRDDLARRRETGLFLPRRHSIARALIDAWLGEGGGETGR
jgi:NAD+ diphosphatase